MTCGVALLEEVLQERLEEKKEERLNKKKTGRPARIRETENGIEQFCSKCKQYFPADLEHFYKDGRSKTGLSSWCRTCQAASVRRSKSSAVENPMAMVLDFSDHEILFKEIHAAAKTDFRTVEMQAMWILSNVLTKQGGKDE